MGNELVSHPARGSEAALGPPRAAQAGVSEPEILARQLHLLYDSSGQSARPPVRRG
jgi:hypothetical protein